jgi:hypothetical protein
MDMSNDPTLKPYLGGIRQNTFKFFEHRAFTVGMTSEPETRKPSRIERSFLPESAQYQKLLFQGERLLGASGINMDLDPGIMLELIRKKIDLSVIEPSFLANPVENSRILMTNIWR